MAGALLVPTAAVGSAWIGHWKLHIIQSASMGSALPRNSIAIVAPVDPRSIGPSEIIAFANPGDRRFTTVHRVVERVEQQGSVFYKTQGDANATADPLLVATSDVRGKVRGHVPRLGAPLRRAKAPWTYLVLIGLPAALFFRGELLRRQTAAGRRG